MWLLTLTIGTSLWCLGHGLLLIAPLQLRPRIPIFWIRENPFILRPVSQASPFPFFPGKATKIPVCEERLLSTLSSNLSPETSMLLDEDPLLGAHECWGTAVGKRPLPTRGMSECALEPALLTSHLLSFCTFYLWVRLAPSPTYLAARSSPSQLHFCLTRHPLRQTLERREKLFGPHVRQMIRTESSESHPSWYLGPLCPNSS